MARLLRFLLIARFKQRQTHQGFTLIELLVAMIIAVLVMTPLMALAINLINTDRREQAKSTSEQELQSAADFIARDLERAIYVYDAVALTRNHNAIDANISGIRDQIPPIQPVSGCNNTATCIPVLAFWTRRPVHQAVPLNSTINCNSPSTNHEQVCDDTFVYSLVVYYLIVNQNNNNVWSNTARIGRFQISDGVKLGENYLEDIRNTQAFVSDGNKRDAGFAPFNLGLNESIRLSMNQWKQGKKNLSTRQISPEPFGRNSMQILVDYIDHTTLTTNIPTPLCSSPVTPDPHTGWIQSPYYGTYQNPVAIGNATPAQFQTYSFYSCINAQQGIAKIYLRGNALARIQGRNNPPQFSTSPNIQAFFPTISIEVNAEGAINQ
ncbi:hormogonium polysaccharide secretion pseudopilin HpsC [Spirulina sp. CCNP1310]|uniref:hormogonium polysaccharide secretion pseudopilin HpsC n=1 Tax=Spirulina sp. CCNP1310 TaxID=3110249 RepID=UPI002B1FDAFF|nr:hormogonium polysaccharide secretion pseudopilin HpsC [Spirulina sp. CCNP1310]MEA5419092.1 hormogonium polysaccharide secretion pseudopilin HpsC [Spirulina sp. CCNP1310]